MNKKKELLNQIEIDITIERLCQQLIENHQEFLETVIIGVQPRGIFLSNRIVKRLNKMLNKKEVKLGYLDIAFYRDDLRRRNC